MTASSSFPRVARLLDSAGFAACFAQRQRLSGRYFSINWIQQSVGPRLGLAVSRKVDRRAVQRNRLKRLLREWFRQHRGSGRLPALDLVITPRREAVTAERAALLADLDGLLARLLSRLPAPNANGTMPAASAGPDVTSAAADPSLAVALPHAEGSPTRPPR